MHDPRRFAPATARNREPILDVLRRYVDPGANVLEIASGSGEHAMFLGPRLEVATWQPSDPDAESRASIDAWCAHADVGVVLPAAALDVQRPEWDVGLSAPDVIVCVNMIHIAPWAACEGLIAGASRLLGPRRILYLYGPYRREGRHTAPSNEAFDASLRARDPSWGVRDLEAVTELAEKHGFARAAVVEMPTNNLSVVFRR